ncbi:hypothetical protein [Bacillus benzoevorans]|uniref:Biotin synthase-related radical SAM superfamily protein n=1 Tax=Bacillus benzoevorans TaxID=1456 RepID=A0A7X0LVX0_9BACI|nr:hypothetical protein [Bacillus benzoevorans]MBB6446456.1 biotin synthase-related radical SAM superfamily protein [Bacillus benzoevorans]
MKQFTFDQSFQEVEIAGVIYKVDMSDDKVREYQKSFQKYYVESQQLSQTDVEKMSADEQLELYNKTLEAMKEVTEVILGEGTFAELYEKSGKSTRNYMKLLLFIADIFSDQFEDVKNDALNKYLNKK